MATKNKLTWLFLMTICINSISLCTISYKLNKEINRRIILPDGIKLSIEKLPGYSAADGKPLYIVQAFFIDK